MSANSPESRPTPSNKAGARGRLMAAAVLLGAIAIAGYVHHSMSQVRQQLPLELLEQQRDIAAIASTLGGLVGALDRQLPRAPEANVDEARLALQRTHVLLRTVRRGFTFDSLTGASAAHALVNPAVQDMERWLSDGLPGYAPSSRVVLELVRDRAREAHESVYELENQTDALALALLSAESERLNRVRYSLMALVLAFSILTAGVVVLYARQRTARERVAVTEARLVDSLESAGQAVALYDGNERLLMCNRGYRALFRIQSSRDTSIAVLADVVNGALEARHILSINDETENLADVYAQCRTEAGASFELQWNDGRFFQVSEQVTKENGTICFLTNITDLKVAQRRLEYLAAHDALTGLPSRRRFHADLTQVIQRAGESSQQAAVVFLDVDRLKWINDTYGHVAGDQYLKEFGLRLGGALRAGDRVARLGGDEFALALGDVEDAAEASNLARRMLEMLAEPVQVDEDTLIRTTVSMGIALYPDDARDASTLMKYADDACYYAKSNGRATYQLFNDRISARSARRAKIEHHLREALQERHLVMVYQPQVCVDSGEVTGLEALIRWQHPELGSVDPSEFVPVAEDSGLGRLLLGNTVDEVCREVRGWLDTGVRLQRVWINVPPRQLPDVVSAVSEAVERHQLSPGMLGIEITERTFVDDPVRAGKALGEIRDQGMNVAIDDFGVGYSSLGALKDYPLDELKIDASFVRGLSTQGQDTEIVRAIVALAGSLGLTVVAEGVETLEQLQVLRARKVDTVQGNLVSAPLSGDDVGSYLAGPVNAAWPDQMNAGAD